MDGPEALETANRPFQLRALNQASSPLLRLPRELRDQILSLAISSLPPTVIFPRQLPTILQACHQLRHEMAEIFYATKKIFLLSAEHYYLHNHLDPWHKRYLRKVYVGTSWTKRHEAKLDAAYLDEQLGLPSGTFWVRYNDSWFGYAYPDGIYCNAAGEEMN